MSGSEGGDDPRRVAERYFATWRAKDFTAFRVLLADDVSFRGPLGEADGAESCVEGIRGMSRIVEDIVVRHMWADGPDVRTWFDLHTSVAPPAPTANWSRVENGRISRIRVTFDARPLAPPEAR